MKATHGLAYLAPLLFIGSGIYEARTYDFAPHLHPAEFSDLMRHGSLSSCPFHVTGSIAMDLPLLASPDPASASTFLPGDLSSTLLSDDRDDFSRDVFATRY
jgi:hypothetical protein